MISAQADWVMMSLCSAHLEEKHQWGAGIGVEDDLFLTNEEWTSYKDGAPYTGIPGHAIELATMRMYAVGVFTLGGFEKIVEVNCGHPDYVCFSPSGYNARRPRPRDGSARNIDAPRPAAGQLRHVGPDEQERAGRAPRRQPVCLAQVRRAEPPLRRQEGLQRPGAAGLGLPQPQRPRVGTGPSNIPLGQMQNATAQVAAASGALIARNNSNANANPPPSKGFLNTHYLAKGDTVLAYFVTDSALASANTGGINYFGGWKVGPRLEQQYE